MAGFVLDSHWYWDLFEGGAMLAPAAVTSDLLVPLARVAHGRFTIEAIEADPDGGGVRFVVATCPVAIRFALGASDRTLVDRFITELNASFARADVRHVFALAVPKRYEVRGVLIADDELAAAVRDPSIRLPSDRAPWAVRASRPSLA